MKKAWEEKSPRTVSIIKMDVSDADNLTETETKKKSNIDKALEKKALRMSQKPSLKIQIPLIKMDLQDM